MGRSVPFSSGSEAQRGHQRHHQSYLVRPPRQTQQLFSMPPHLHYILMLPARFSTRLPQAALLMFALLLGAIKHASMLHAFATYVANIVLQLAVAH
jgi:hypothetical protein